MGLILRALQAALVAACIALCAPASAADPLQRVLDEPVGTNPAYAFHLVEALRRLQHRQEADLLERYLLEAYVEQLAGRPHDGSRTVAVALKLAAPLPPWTRSGDLSARWNAQLNAQLAPALAPASATPPEEITGFAQAPVQLAPGYWAFERRRYVTVSVTNAARAPLALPEFAVFLRAAQAAVPMGPFLCQPPRGATLVGLLQPGGKLEVSCVGGAERDADAAAVFGAVRSLPGLVEMRSGALVEERQRERMVQALAGLQQARLQLLLDPGTQAAGRAAVPEPRRRAAAARAPEPSTETGASPRSGGFHLRDLDPMELWGRGLWVRFGMVLFVIAGYWALARTIGNGAAALLFWLMSTGYGMSVIAGVHGSGTGWVRLLEWMIELLALVLPAVVTALLYGMMSVYNQQRAAPEEFEQRVRKGFLQFAFELLLALLGLRRR